MIEICPHCKKQVEVVGRYEANDEGDPDWVKDICPECGEEIN